MRLDPSRIIEALSKPLPGEIAQLTMAPHPAGTSAGPIPPPPPGTRRSGVLLLLSNKKGTGDTQVTLTLRSSRLISHSGQLSFPGGRMEKGESAEIAALRETEEEIGIPANLPRILGRLSTLHVPHSGNLIYPIVGWVDALPAFKLEPFEVSEAFQVDIRDLLNPDLKRVEQWPLHGKTYTVPHWNFHKTVPLWGATAMMLGEFIAVLETL